MPEPEIDLLSEPLDSPPDDIDLLDPLPDENEPDIPLSPVPPPPLEPQKTDSPAPVAPPPEPNEQTPAPPPAEKEPAATAPVQDSSIPQDQLDGFATQLRLLEHAVHSLENSVRTLQDGEASALQLRETLQKTCHYLDHTTRYYYKVLEALPIQTEAAYRDVAERHKKEYSAMLRQVAKVMAESTGKPSAQTWAIPAGIAVIQLIVIFLMTR